MTDKIPTTSRTASAAVGEFLRTATKPQKLWFMTRGEPTCLSLTVMDADGLKSVFYPSLRGITVGQTVASPEEAVAAAAKVKADIIATETLEAVDEVELGIDDEALDLADLFDDNLVRIDQICHVGTMFEGSAAEPLERIIDDLMSYDKSSAFDDLPFLRKLADSLKPKAKSDDEDADEEERPSSGEILEDALMVLRDNGAVGFFVEASVPEISDVREGAYSVHYGMRRTDIHYASTYRRACLKALAWGKAELAAMEADPKRRRKAA
jgi:hypothetical protein